MRFAPSPTGALHLGNIRTALFEWLSARSTGGQFILRIEDTDQGRHVPGSEHIILETLQWLGLQWDEGPDIGGPHAPYVQSLRTAIFAEVAAQLNERGAAYWCTCTPQRLDAMRASQRAARQPTRYDRHCLTRQDEVADQRASGTHAVLRQRMPEGRTEWIDLIRGHVSFDNAEIDDSVLLKSDGFPTYHLAATADDHIMEVTHVLRAEEWLPSTPKHLSIFDAMGWNRPEYAHLPVVLGEDRQKLSKRRGAPSMLEYRELGYLPSALVNAMALLGWSSGTEDEVFTPEELVQRFRLERVNPAPAIFDSKRLDALNGLHLRRLDAQAFAAAAAPWLPQADPAALLRIVPLVQERIARLGQLPGLCAPLFTDPRWDDGLEFPPRKVDMPTAVRLLDTTISAIRDLGVDDPDRLRERITAALDERGVKARDAFRVLYIAVLGSPQGVPVFAAMRFIGADRTLQRLESVRHRVLPAT